MQHEPAANVAAGYGVSLRTERKWKSRHAHGGQDALADLVRAQDVAAAIYLNLIFVRYTRGGKREKPEMK